MKKMNKLFMLGVIILALASCGKENDSGGGGNNNPNNGGTFNNVESINYSNYDDFRNRFKNKSVTDGLSNGQTVYHIGPAFGGDNFNQFNFDYDIDFGACGYILWFEIGDCNTGPSYNLQSYIDKGEIKEIRSLNGDKVNYDQAVGVDNSGYNFVYDAKVYDKNDEFYRAIINADNKSVKRVVINAANVGVSNGSIRADYVEYFFNDGTYKGFVVSNQLPLIANPVAIVEGFNYGSSRNLTGVLGESGNMKVMGFTITPHVMIRNGLSEQLQRMQTLRYSAGQN